MTDPEHKENTSEGLEADKIATSISDNSPESNSNTEAKIPSEAVKPKQPVKKAAVKKVKKEETEEAPKAEAATVAASTTDQVIEPTVGSETETLSEASTLTPIAGDKPAAAENSGGMNDDEDGAEGEHEEEQDDEELYASYSIDQLVERYVEYSKADVLNEVRNSMKVLQGLIEHHFEQERNDKLTRFLADGNKEEDFAPNANPLHLLFLETSNKYGQRRAKERESRELDLQNNYRAKEALLAEMQQLIEDEETKGITDIDKLRSVQDQWKQIGQVPPAKRNEQWQRYHFLNDKFYDNLRINRELKELDLIKNLESKNDLCDKAEELLLENSIKTAVEGLSLLHEQWKEIGPVPREQKEAIWDRFKAASDKIYEKRKAYFHQLDEAREENLRKKEALCQQLEALITTLPKEHNGWQKLSENVEKLQGEWKSIGFATKSQNTAIWRRFKQTCDQFFIAKNVYYKSIRQEQLENLQAKEALCVQAEALKESEDWKETTEELIRLQKEWKKTGAVNRKISDKVWNRFRKACDHFFERKKQHFGGQDARQEDNLKAKIAIIEKIEEFEGSGKQHEDLEALKAFQKEWLDIGFIPIKQKKEINERYREALNKHFDVLKISVQEKTKLNFQSKLETLKSGKDGDKALRKEQFQIQSRMNHLKNDILLWENNMEFFAASKNAELMKKEIETKIDKAKAELEQLQQKLLLLRDV